MRVARVKGMRAAARENRLGVPEDVFHAKGTKVSGDVPSAIPVFINHINGVLVSLDKTNEKAITTTVIFHGQSYSYVQIEVSILDDASGFESDDDTEECSVSHQPYCLVHQTTGDVYAVDPIDMGPSGDSGVRGNVLVSDSFNQSIDKSTGYLKLFGETVAEYLFSLDLDVNATDAFGETILMQAAAAAHSQLVRWLVLEAHADVNLQTNAGSTALLKAVFAGSVAHEEVARILVNEGKANVNLGNIWGTSPLHLAAFRGNLRLCRMLVEEFGAERECVDKKGKTPGDFSHEDSCEPGRYDAELEALLSHD